MAGGHSAVFGQRVEMFIDHLKIGIDIDGSGSNVPMVYDCACSHKEIKTHAHGPFGHSAVFGQRVEMFIDHLMIGIDIDIDGSGSNVPMVYDCACSHKEIKTHGPFVRSALPAYERKVAFLDGWSVKHFVGWQMATMAVGDEFEH